MNTEEQIEAFATYVESVGRSNRTAEIYRQHLRYWQKYLAEKNIADPAQLTPQLVTGYQAWLYNYRTRFGKPFSLSSQRSLLMTFRLFLRFLVKRRLLLADPTAALQLPKEPERLPGRALSPHEVKKLLAQPDPATILGFRDRTLLEVLYSTGLRTGELIRLRVNDLNLSEGTLTVLSGKGGKDRVVPLGKTACRYLAKYLKNVRPLLLRAPAVDVVFPDRYGHVLSPQGILKKLAVYAKRAGIKKRVIVHTFRHTLATEMLKKGADLRQIQELLGHDKLTTTQIYTHVVKGELKRVQEQCHPREQTALPAGFVQYRGRAYLTDEERHHNRHVPPP